MKATAARVDVSPNPAPFEIDDKRFYLPGMKLHATCPRCGQEVVRDYGDDYLSFPTANAEFVETLCHYDSASNKEHEFTVTLKLSFMLEVCP